MSFVTKNFLVWQCQIDFLFAITWKKFNAQWTTIILFLEKNQYVKRNFLFILSNCHGNAFLWNNLSGKSFEWQFQWLSDEIVVYLAFKYVLNKNLSGWTTSHSAELHF